MTILITGGAGYIGSHMVRYLLDKSLPIVIIDNFSTGHHFSLPNNVQIRQVDLRNQLQLDRCFSTLPSIDAIIHFAGLSIVSESFKHPEDYYANNVGGTLNLLASMRKYNIKNIVFSSTAAVYGTPTTRLISEQQETKPINPYGRSKLIAEILLQEYADAYGINAISLRYFNAAGADFKNNLGEMHSPETHLVPLLLEALILDKEFSIFGNDYETPDGTCIRDYVHILDLCEAHLLSLNYLKTHKGFHTFNLGNGKGNSVMEIVNIAAQLTHKQPKINIAPRRRGDPPILIADTKLAKQQLGWKSLRSSIENIIHDAWQWQQTKSLIKHKEN